MKSTSRNPYHKITKSDEYTVRGGTTYIAQIEHTGLKVHRTIKDKDDYFFNSKIQAQLDKWDATWEKQMLREKKLSDKNYNHSTAEELTKLAKERISQIENILVHTLSKDDRIKWDSIKSKGRFEKVNPKDNLYQEIQKLTQPKKYRMAVKPEAPKRRDFIPDLGLWDKLFSYARQKKIVKAEGKYQTALAKWQLVADEVDLDNNALKRKEEQSLSECEKDKAALVARTEVLELEWEQEKKQFQAQQKEFNDKIEEFRLKYTNSDPDTILQHAELVLSNSEYPDSFPKDFNLDYNPGAKLLIVDYTLPAPADLPTLSEVKFISARNELKETTISETQLSKMYDTAIYNISLRTAHELFEADVVGAIEIVVFNGWVEVINRANCKLVKSCIISLQVKKQEFQEIDLAHIDPKICFKNLKGVGSSKLSGISAIQPIMSVSREDKRFVSSYEVSSTLNEGYNLASMGWEDFEHLLRELFEQEFSSNGGEVKVTRASRDGGVDAIAFDPDPIRGGKIVIQAKRYTNTVGVSAVRDLFGTVMAEGATKGILVTTADYGPDAYEFVKNKPLTLLNGGHLLHLLEKHGHKARIDIAEAKRSQAFG